MDNQKPDVIAEVLNSLSDRIRDERKDSPIYQQLAGRPTMISRLRLANHLMMQTVLALTDVLRDVDGIDVSAEKYDLLKALPKIEDDLAKHFRDTEGHGLSVDKAYQQIARLLREV